MTERRKILPQEALKLIACVTMLLDHTGAVLLPYFSGPYMDTLYYVLRGVGRLAFPIYAFLLVEGMSHTRNPYRYMMRLGLGVLLAEIPYDFGLFGGWTWAHQSVMVTLLLGAGMLLCMEKTENKMLKQLIMLLFAIVAELLCCDYGLWGILMIGVFALTQNFLLQAVCILLINGLIPSLTISVFGNGIPIQLFAVFAMVPIAFYSGKKCSQSRALQWGFYLFYPVHLTLLWLFSLI